MARGAASISRLMEDGVLEDDKGLRNLLRERLRPLVAARDFGLIQPLVDTNGLATRAWLKEFLFRALDECAALESLGAVLILFAILKDDEFADIERFRRYWLRLEPHSKENVFRALPDVYLENAKWRIQCLIEFLANEETYKFASQVLPHSLVFDSNQGFQNQVIELIRSSLGIVSAELFALYSLPRSPQQIENFGWARIYQANASIVPKDALLKLSNQVEKVKLAGFFEVIKCALKYACRHTHESLVELFVILNDSWELLDFLPECIRELIPHTPSCDTSNAVLQAIRLMTPDELAIAMDTPDGRIWNRTSSHSIQVRSLDNNAPAGKEDFYRLAETYPEVALKVWGYRCELGQKDFFNDSETIDLIFDLIKRYPQYCQVVSIREWNQLILHSQIKSSWLRHLITNFYDGSELSFWGNYQLSENEKYFEITLPDERNLLVPLCSVTVGMYASVHSGYYHPNNRFSEDFQKQIIRMCSRVAQQCVAEVQKLELLADDASSPTEVRSAAILMGVLHPEGGIEVAFRHAKQLVSSCRAGSWAGIGLALCCEILEIERRSTVLALLSSLLDATRDCEVENLPAEVSIVIEQWDTIFRRWREKSHAPVTSSGQVEDWLTSAEAS